MTTIVGRGVGNLLNCVLVEVILLWICGWILGQVKLATCQRVLLLNYDKKTKLFDFRHYSISAQPTGVSRNIRKLVQRKKLPDLSNLTDVSEFVSK